MKSIRIALALALAAALSGCSGDDPAALLASARHYQDQRDFSASIIQLKNVLQKAPDDGEARYLLGRALLEQGNAVMAQIELDKALQLGFASDGLQLALVRAALARGEADRVPERFGATALSTPSAQAELRALIGMAYLARRQTDEARRSFDQAMKLDAADVTANLGGARLAAAQENFAEALARVERALAAAPVNIEALLLKADVLAIQHRHDDAEKTLRAAIEAAPKQPDPRFALIVHLLRRGAPDKAALESAAMERAVPQNPVTFYAKAMVLSEEKKYPAARQAILQVLKAAPEHVPSLTLAGMAALQTDALPEAESHLRKAVFGAPQATGAKRLLAATHLRMGQTETALNEAKELLAATRGEDPGVHALAAEAYLASGDLSGAARHFERAKALSPANTGIQTRLAQVRFAAGDGTRAIAELEAASAGNAQDYQADLALIAAHLRQREADKALTALQGLEKKQPNHPLTHNLRGGALLLKGDAAGARASFERALALQPVYLPAAANLAQLDLREKDAAAARQRYERVLKLEPNNAQAMLGLAELLRTLGAGTEEIGRLLARSVAANPASPAARASLVNFHLANGDAKAALAAAQQAHAALPGSAPLLELLGTTQLAAGEARQAVASLTRLAETLPKAAAPRVLLARAHMAAKQPEEALKALRAALELRPDLAAVQRDIVAVYLATGRPDEALRQARAAQAENPQQPHGHVLEAEVLFAQKKLDLAERSYRAALKKFDLPALAIRAHAVMQAAGKRGEAQSLAEDWIRHHPKDTAMLAYLADRDIAERRYESAAARYRSALERLPDNAALLNNLAWVSHELKRPDALELAERAHGLAPDSPAVMDTLGAILADRGEMERGLQLLGQAVRLAPEAPQIRLNFAKALIKAERKPAARRELEGLAKLDPRLPAQQEAARLLATF